jgi:hypothetical protein
VIRVLPRWCAALAAIVLLMSASAASAQTPTPPGGPQSELHFFAADTTEPGVISLFFFGAEGAPVVFYERIGERLERLGRASAPAGGATPLKAAAVWRCARLVRHFEATSTLPDGTLAHGAYSVRTPSCASRFFLGVPRRIATGERAKVRVVDRWGNGGVSPQLCIKAPREKASCDMLRLRRAVSVATRNVRAPTPGNWRVELRIRGHLVRRSIAVGEGATSSAPPPTVLTTGDSMMQGIDSFLADELGDAMTVSSDVRPGTGISKLGSPWRELPRAQTKRLKQEASVIAVGANEGFPMKGVDEQTHECCEPGWVAEYSRKVRGIMRTYLRDGKGRVIWLTLPIPKGPRAVADAVNQAIVTAATGMQRVTVLRLDQFFSPNGFREVMPYRGRDVRVREVDGIHLNVAGTAIAAKLVAAALREEP